MDAQMRKCTDTHVRMIQIPEGKVFIAFRVVARSPTQLHVDQENPLGMGGCGTLNRASFSNGNCPMSDAHDALRRKFAQRSGDGAAAPRLPPPPRPTPSSTRRKRKRLTLRLSDGTLEGLQLLKVMLGRDMNSLCEEYIGAAVAEKVADLEARASPGDVDVIRRYAAAKKA
jgi:hypothetical protein